MGKKHTQWIGGPTGSYQVGGNAWRMGVICACGGQTQKGSGGPRGVSHGSRVALGRVQREYGCSRLCGILFVMIRLTLGRTSEGEVVGVGVLSIELAVCCG